MKGHDLMATVGMVLTAGGAAAAPVAAMRPLDARAMSEAERRAFIDAWASRREEQMRLMIGPAQRKTYEWEGEAREYWEDPEPVRVCPDPRSTALILPAPLFGSPYIRYRASDGGYTDRTRILRFCIGPPEDRGLCRVCWDFKLNALCLNLPPDQEWTSRYLFWLDPKRR